MLLLEIGAAVVFGFLAIMGLLVTLALRTQKQVSDNRQKDE